MSQKCQHGKLLDVHCEACKKLYDSLDKIARLESELEQAKKETRSWVTAAEVMEKQRDSARVELKQVKGVLDMSQDEYVQQVGSWKIIQRLESELEEWKERSNRNADSAMKWAKDCNQARAEVTSLRSLAEGLCEFVREVAQPGYPDSDYKSLYDTVSSRAYAILKGLSVSVDKAALDGGKS